MALSLRVTRAAYFGYGCGMVNFRRLSVNLLPPSHLQVSTTYRANVPTCFYCTQRPAESTSQTTGPPQIKRNIASEITSVGKMIYESDWDAKSKETKKTDGTTAMSTQSSKSSSSLPSDDKDCDGQKSKREQMRDNMQDYIFTRYFNYVKNYDKVLEKNFPKAMQLYRAFFEGVRDFFLDMKRFLKITRIANDSPLGIRALNRQELELYMQMPRDMIKVAPALIGCSLPVVGYAVFPLVFYYPRTFLTSHFWTPQQRSEFREYFLKCRLQGNKPVFRCLQSKLKSLKVHHKHTEFERLLGQLGSGFHPAPEAIIEIKDIFAEGPYSLIGMSRKHVNCLMKLHGLQSSIFKRHRLREHAFLVHYMDLAINREGGVHNLSTEALRNSCNLRGLNPVNLSNEDMIEWLRKWVQVSTSIGAEHITLFLHLPILLGYNHPNNWKVIYCKPST